MSRGSRSTSSWRNRRSSRAEWVGVYSMNRWLWGPWPPPCICKGISMASYTVALVMLCDCFLSASSSRNSSNFHPPRFPCGEHRLRVVDATTNGDVITLYIRPSVLDTLIHPPCDSPMETCLDLHHPNYTTPEPHRVMASFQSRRRRRCLSFSCAIFLLSDPCGPCRVSSGVRNRPFSLPPWMIMPLRD